MPLRIADAPRGDPVEIRRLDGTAVASERREADVVETDADDVRRPLRRPRSPEWRPIRLRITYVNVDRALEWCAHVIPCPRWPSAPDLRRLSFAATLARCWSRLSVRRIKSISPQPRHALLFCGDASASVDAGCLTLASPCHCGSPRVGGPGTRRLVQLSSLGGLHRHARIHDEALVSGVRRPRPHTGHRHLTATP